MFVDFLLMEDYEQGAVKKGLIIVLLTEQFQTATLRKFFR